MHATAVGRAALLTCGRGLPQVDLTQLGALVSVYGLNVDHRTGPMWTVVWMSITSLATSPGTEVDPMWSTPRASTPTDTRSCTASWRKRSGRIGSQSEMISGLPAISPSGEDAVAEVYDTVAESAIVQQREVCASVAGQRRLASADEDGTDKQMALIDQPGLEKRALRGARPPTVRSLVAEAFMSRTEAGSKLRSSRVLAVDTASRVEE